MFNIQTRRITMYIVYFTNTSIHYTLLIHQYIIVITVSLLQTPQSQTCHRHLSQFDLQLTQTGNDEYPKK